MRRIDKIIFVAIILITAGAVVSLVTQDFKLGLDLDGGAHLVYEADFSELPEDQDEDSAMKGIVKVIEKRVNTYGVSEPVIERMSDDRVLVQLPGIDDIEEAKSRIGETALIRFMEFQPYVPTEDSGLEQPPDSTSTDQPSESDVPAHGAPEAVFVYRFDDDDELDLTQVDVSELQEGEEAWIAVPAAGTVDGEMIELTSQFFDGDVEFDLYGQYAVQPVVVFNWDDTGAKLSEEITTRLRGEPLGIFLVDDLISSPIVEDVIKDSGIIRGMSESDAKDLISLLNAGRIPVPLHTVEEHNVSPTLGEDFIDWSIEAGIVGMALLILFLIVYYRLPGVMASLALLIYAALVMAAFQVIDIVLTLAGLAGFILSIGMAVDANVLIFERMKEELRNGRTVRAAVEVGFNRAWPAIRDSNISTFITCGILYWMGDSLTVPTIKGFALTLLIGVAISMFSAIIVTRTFLRMLGSARMIDKNPILIPAKRPMVLSVEGR